MDLRYMFRLLWSKSIVRYMLVSYLSINLILLYLLGLVSIRDSTSTITKEIKASSYKVMKHTARQLDFNLEEAKRPLIQFAGHYSVVAMMSQGEDRAIPVEERIQHERNISDLAGGVTSLQSLISDILILGSNGYVNNMDNRKTLKWNYPFTEQAWYKNAVSSELTKGFIPLYLHKQDYYLPTIISKFNQPTFSIAIPVKGYSQQIIGAVIANFDLQKINGLFEPSTGQNGEEIFMIDQDQKVMVHPDKEKIGSSIHFEGIENLRASVSGSFITPVNGEEKLVIYHPTSFEGLRLVSTIPMAAIEGQSGALKKKLAGILYACLVTNTLLAVLIALRISRPFGRLLFTIDHMGEAEKYGVHRRFKYREFDLISDKFKELVERVEHLTKQNYMSQLNLRDAQLKALQSQIHPHFLFNTLQLLQTEIVCGNTEDSNRIILSLSNLLRYSMRGWEEPVELQSELQNAQDYLYIVNKKYEDRIDIAYDLPDKELLRCRAVKLMLQPIVENAIIHGFKENPRSAQIRIQAVPARRGILVTVQDNGAGMSRERCSSLVRRLEAEDMSEENIGLRNVNQRIKLTFGDPYGIRIRSRLGQGTTVYIMLPNQG